MDVGRFWLEGETHYSHHNLPSIRDLQSEGTQKAGKFCQPKTQRNKNDQRRAHVRRRSCDGAAMPDETPDAPPPCPPTPEVVLHYILVIILTV